MSQKIIWFCKDQMESVGTKPIITPIQSDALQVYACRIPRYYAAKKQLFKRKMIYTTWNKAALLQTMQNCCLTLCADKYYVEAEFEFHELAEPAFWNVKQRMEEELLVERLGKVGQVNQILWIPGVENICRNIPMEVLGKVRKFYVLNAWEEKGKAWYKNGNTLDENRDDKLRGVIKDAENFLWNEYGMPLLHIDSLQEISCKKEERLMILYDNDCDLSLKQIPCKMLCFDLWSDEKLHERIAKERPDAKYFSEYCHLQKLLNRV